MRRSSLNIAWLLLGILALAAIIMKVGARESVANPTINSYRPSGLSAFADLLRTDGYRVRVDISPLPRLDKDDVAIACLDGSGDPEDPLATKQLEATSPGVYGRIADFAKSGGNVLFLTISPRFGDFKPETAKVANPVTGTHLKLEVRPFTEETVVVKLLPDGLTSTAIWSWENTASVPFAELSRYGKGTVASTNDGYIACNTFIDRQQNADVLMSLVGAIAPKGSTLVFTEATYSGATSGLIQILGPWAGGIWYQSIFLFLVIAFTLGKRFGLPEEVRVTQTGQRELVDAIADTYRRARSTGVACRSAYNRADLEVRKALKLSADAPASASASERDNRIPAELAEAFRSVFEGTITTLSPTEAFQRCQNLLRRSGTFVNRDR